VDDDLLRSAIRRLAVDERDSEAWEDLYKGLYPLLFATLFRIFKGNKFLAEESAQEVMIRLLRSFNFTTNTVSVPSLVAYLNKTARSVAFDLLRKEKRFERNEDIANVEDSLFSNETESSEKMIALERLLREAGASLPARDGRILQMLTAGLTNEEIAKSLNVSKKTAYNLTSIVRQRLRPFLFSAPGNI
jgi:RNA polymerase sigma factor (sigma-70 family)